MFLGQPEIGVCKVKLKYFSSTQYFLSETLFERNQYRVLFWCWDDRQNLTMATLPQEGATGEVRYDMEYMARST